MFKKIPSIFTVVHNKHRGLGGCREMLASGRVRRPPGPSVHWLRDSSCRRGEALQIFSPETSHFFQSLQEARACRVQRALVTSFQEGKAEFKGTAYKPGLMGNRAPFRRGAKLQVRDGTYCEQGGSPETGRSS